MGFSPWALHSELNAWLMPPTAHAEWLRLAALLDELPDDAVPCRADPGAWWPERKQLAGEATQEAVTGCRRCAAQVACLDYAMAADERFGIWGATLPEERRSMPASAAKTSPTMRIMAAS
jgi:hypothetical protein